MNQDPQSNPNQPHGLILAPEDSLSVPPANQEPKTPVPQAPTSVLSTEPQPPLQTNQTTVPPTKSNFLRYFLISVVLILFGILIGVLAARFLPMTPSTSVPVISPTPSVSSGPLITTPTATISAAIITSPAFDSQNWKTYSDPQKLYSIKYPPEAKVSSYTSTTTSFTYIGPTQQKSGRTQTELADGYKVSVDYQPFTAQQSPETMVNDIYRQARQGCPVPEEVALSPLTKITISGQLAWQYIINNCLGDATVSFVAYKDKLYSLTAMYASLNSNDLPKYLEKASQIISTFQFSVSSNTSYTCPATEWVDCMPSTDSRPRPQCSREFLDWARVNCPDFQGVAL